MQSVEERINIVNKVFVKNIKKQIKYINETNLNDEVKNNLSMAGNLLISSINMYKREETLASISLLRNVYEMTLKGMVLDKNPEILKAYKTINKTKKEEKDRSSEIRKFIGKNFNEYFYTIENNKLLKDIYGEGVLTFLYKKLCGFSHASAIMEALYKVEKDELILRQAIIVCYVYAMVAFYIDATSVKINKLDASEDTSLFYSLVLIFTLRDWSRSEELCKLNKYNSIIDLSIEANQLYYDKEKEFMAAKMLELEDDWKEVNDLPIEEQQELEKNINRCLKKYCGKKKYLEFISSILNGK